jgi:hypothetical protein
LLLQHSTSIVGHFLAAYQKLTNIALLAYQAVILLYVNMCDHTIYFWIDIFKITAFFLLRTLASTITLHCCLNNKPKYKKIWYSDYSSTKQHNWRASLALVVIFSFMAHHSCPLLSPPCPLPKLIMSATPPTNRAHTGPTRLPRLIQSYYSNLQVWVNEPAPLAARPKSIIVVLSQS